MKIRTKIFFLIFSVVFFIMLGIYMGTEFYLEKFYIKNKRDSLAAVSQLISSPNYYMDLDQLERENNVTVYIRALSSKNPLNISEEIYLEKLEKRGVLENMRAGERDFQKMQLDDPVGEFMILFTPYQKDKFLEIRTPLSSITEGVSIAARYYMRIILYAMFFGIALAFILSKKITSPIIELKEITKKIASLNFSSKFTSGRRDEIGELGHSINQMGDILNETIGELNLANERLKLDIEKEKKLESLRKEFVASVSHELKTPIALIQGYAQGLQEGVAKEEDRDFYCSVIVEESQKMDELVKELLLISQIESGYLELNIKEINISEMIRQAMYKYYMEHQNHKISSPETDIVVMGDEKYIKRALRNLIGNAFKYSPDGGEIRVEAEECESEYTIRIFNSCIDLREDELREIWTPFYRGDKSRSSEGTGLGLTIVKGILEKHRSSYGVELKEEHVVFWFTLKKPVEHKK